ncbi:MAG: 1-(5-phosphoribosyl)-5-[(5-phosphoribosylamino)methylideneamino] imidazole-4-carboxamide isomerase [Bacteroidetes bacterium]|nr:1-(5-phosphoribosyl)-5-[(5-phosphoribosylamino)methylideneamino] imidazole-4-carboxamide isomerase [Bacteroidota bacterium]
MLVIPAIDLQHGRCVRHCEGRIEDETEYFADPLLMAKLWRVQNAKVLHLANLDGAYDNAIEVNLECIKEIAAELDIPVQVGGGIRSLEAIKTLIDSGVYRVVVGTMAVRSPDLVEEAIRQFGSSRIVVGIDAVNGQIRTEGRSKDAGLDAVTHALDMERRGVKRFVYTGITREGMLTGPNIPAYRALASRLTTAHITAAGGVSGYRDLLALQALEPLGVDSVIIGRALYENQFPCQKIWCWHEKDRVDLSTPSTAPLSA